MRSKRDIKMVGCVRRGVQSSELSVGSVTFRFLNGEAILDENMLFCVRLYALVVVLKFFSISDYNGKNHMGFLKKKRSLWGATSL